MSPNHNQITINPKSVIRPNVRHNAFFYRSVHAITAFLSPSCAHPCFDVVRYAYTSDAANVLETNVNKT